MLGETLAHYEILEKVGSGGMGDVYRAHDKKLHRDVAIKVLSEKLEANPERLARFEREAQLLASLNHPNIATIHGLERDGDVQFLVLELVEGETLAEHFAHGPMSLERALAFFAQIALGLEAAHDKGIVHRDLKPPNIKITPDGQVKILDFGLGKVFEDAEAGQVDLSQSPTLTRNATRAGVILGTPGYMSPEQACGEPVDKRADIWAFGCCLYEALSGKPTFQGNSVVEILASVMRVEPDWERLPSDTPFLVRRTLERCLEKDAGRRFRDIADVRIDLQDAPSAATEIATETKTRIPYVVLVAVAILGFGILATSLRTSPTPELPVTHVEIDAGRLQTDAILAFSHDGTQLLFHADGQSYLRRMDREQALPTKAGRGVFSPDGEWIAFFRDQSLMKMPTNGGATVTLCPAAITMNYLVEWDLTDTIIFTTKDGIYSVSANGGEPKLLEVTTADSDVLRDVPRFADVLPGGKDILITVGGWYVGSQAALHRVETGERRVLIENANYARYVPTGHIVFDRDDTLYAVRFDLDRLAIEGEPVPVLENVHISQMWTNAQYAFSDTGSLAYFPSRWEGFRRRLVWVDREGNVETIRSIPARITGPRISPDGQSIALSIYEGSRPSVWLTEVARETLTPLLPGQWAFQPIWSPEGDRIAYTGHSEERPEIRPDEIGRLLFVKSLRNDADAELIASGTMGEWSPDGDTLIYTTFGMETLFDVWTVSLSGERTPSPFLAEPYPEYMATFSPDGRWIAYGSRDSLDGQLYVRPVEGAGPKYPIKTGDDLGTQPIWSPDGKEIFYRSGNKMMAVEIETEPTVRASAPRVLFEGDFLYHDANGILLRNFDLSPDGQRFLMVQSEEEPPPTTKIKIVLNWFEELKRLVPVDN